MRNYKHFIFLTVAAATFALSNSNGEDKLFNFSELTPPGLDLGGIPLPSQYQCLTGSVINAAEDFGISPGSKKYKRGEDEDGEFDPMKFLQDLQGTTFSGKCPAAGKVIDNVSCDRLCPNPKDCPKKAEFVIKQNDRAAAAQECVVNESRKFKLEVGCAKGLLDSIKNTANFIMQKVRAGLRKIREVFEQSETVKQDLIAKAKEAAQKEQELDQEIQKAEQEIAQIEGQVQQVKELQRRDADQERMFKEMRDLKIPTARAMSCVFDRPYKACSNAGRADTGEAKSIADYSACAVENRGSLQKDGSEGSRKGSKINEAKALRAQLEKLLGNVRGDAPKQTVVPSSVEQLQALQTEPTRILSYQDLEAKYGAAFRAIKVPGFNVGEFLLSEFRRCFQRASSDRQRDQTLRSTQFGELATKIKNDREQTQRLANNLVTGLAQSFRKADDKLNDGRIFSVDGVSPQRTIIPVAGCVDTKPDIALGCLENLRQLRRAQLTGEDFPPKIGGQVLSIGPSIAGVNGTDKSKPVARACKGLNECRDKYRFFKEETSQAAQEIETKLQPKYKQEAQRIVQTAQEQLAARFGGLSKTLGDQLESMKGMLAGLGISGKVDADTPKSEGIELDKDGLPREPNDIIAFINGGPIGDKIPDLGQGAFDDIYEGIAERTKELEGEMREVADANEEVKQDALACVAKSEEEEFDELKDEVSQLGSLNCGWIASMCDAGKTGLTDIANIISRLGTVDGESASSLAGRVRGVCADGRTNLSKLASAETRKTTKSDEVAKLKPEIATLKRQIRDIDAQLADKRSDLSRVPASETVTPRETELKSAIASLNRDKGTKETELSQKEQELSQAENEFRRAEREYDKLDSERARGKVADCRAIAVTIDDKARKISDIKKAKEKFGDSEADSAE